MHLRYGRPFEAGGVVKTWPHVRRGVVVVDDVDAADEGDAGVDDD